MGELFIQCRGIELLQLLLIVYFILLLVATISLDHWANSILQLKLFIKEGNMKNKLVSLVVVVHLLYQVIQKVIIDFFLRMVSKKLNWKVVLEDLYVLILPLIWVESKTYGKLLLLLQNKLKMHGNLNLRMMDSFNFLLFVVS